MNIHLPRLPSFLSTLLPALTAAFTAGVMVASSATELRAQKPDLVIENFAVVSPSASWKGGEGIDVDIRVRNVGRAATGRGFVVTLHLSRDMAVSQEDDNYITRRNFDALAAGKAVTQRISLVLNPCTEASSSPLYLGAFVDGYRQIDEASEANNGRVDPRSRAVEAYTGSTRCLGFLDPRVSNRTGDAFGPARVDIGRFHGPFGAKARLGLVANDDAGSFAIFVLTGTADPLAFDAWTIFGLTYPVLRPTIQVLPRSGRVSTTLVLPRISPNARIRFFVHGIILDPGLPIQKTTKSPLRVSIWE